MGKVIFAFILIGTIVAVRAAEVRLLDLEPTDAQQIIEKQDQNLNYAPKIESNVPAVRFLGNEPHHVLEDIYLARQYHGQDGIGGYLYGYNVPDIAKTERKKAGGDLRGAYNYIAGNGQEIKVEYWDDGTGFHQIDNVPKILPKQIDDSPEVKAAKDKFLARWHEEAERNSHPAQYPYNNEGQYVKGIGPQAVQPYQQQGQYQQTGNYQQPGHYQQPGQNQQPGQYQPTGQYQQPGQYQAGQYQQTGQYQQPGQYQQSGQYQQKGQNQGPGQFHGQQAGQYQQNQYQQGQSQQSHGPNQLDQYSGQYSENQNVYKQPSEYAGQNHSNEDSGAYDKKFDEEETTGPPKGFFYSFDYPVGIIVNKEGIVKRGDVKDVYDANKAKFEAQLQSGQSGASNQGYLYVKNHQ